MTDPIKLPPFTGRLSTSPEQPLICEYARSAVEQATVDLRALLECRRKKHEATFLELAISQQERAEAVQRAEKAEAEIERLRAELARLTKLPPQRLLWEKGCPVCGIGSQSIPGVYGFVCIRGTCPTRITCGVTK